MSSFLHNLTPIATELDKQCGSNRTWSKFHEIKFWCLLSMIPLSIVGNVSVCVVILCTNKLRHQPLYMFMTSLALTDALLTIVSTTAKVKTELDDGCWNIGSAACWVVRLSEVVFFIVSTLHLLVMTLDRYLAVKYTYEYRVLICRNTPLLILLALWLFSLVWSILSVFQWDAYYNYSIRIDHRICTLSNPNYFSTTYVILYCIPLLLITATATAVHRQVRTSRHGSDVMRSNVDVSDTASLVVENYRMKKESVALRSISIVVATYAIVWTPHIILTFLYPIPRHYANRGNGNFLTNLAFLIRDLLPSLSPSTKPFIFVFFNKTLMCSLQKLCRKVRRNKWMKKRYADFRRKRHTMPVYMADILYNEEEDNYFEMEPLPQNSLPQRRFTL